MRSVWHSLLWKEWREYRWKLAVLSAAVLIPFVMLVSWVGDRSLIQLQQMTIGILFPYGFLAAMFVGMSAAAKENGDGTVSFLRGLPVPMWQAGAAKLFITSIVVTVPILLTMILAFALFRFGAYWAGDFMFGFGANLGTPVPTERGYEWFWQFSVVAVLSTLSLLWWTAALGANRSDEIRAGAIAFLGCVAIWFVIGYSLYQADKQQLGAIAYAVLFAASAAPGAPSIWGGYGAQISNAELLGAGPLSVFLTGHILVIGWFLWRFSRTSQRVSKGEGTLGFPAAAYTICRPCRSQLSALAWKQLRETGPLAVVALAGILAITGLGAWLDDFATYSEVFLSVCAGMSFLVVVVAGIGLYLDDLKPGLSQFWRSRPSNLTLSFAVKYGAGLLVLLTILGIPALVAATFLEIQGGPQHVKQIVSAGLIVAWIVVMAYSLAMTAQCLFRQPIYAAITALLALWLGSFAFFSLFREPHWILLAGTMLVSLAGTIALGWLAVKNDWGWKR